MTRNVTPKRDTLVGGCPLGQPVTLGCSASREFGRRLFGTVPLTIRLRIRRLGASQYCPGMTAPDPTDVARKLRQHDNEFEAVYDLLSVVDGKIDALEAKVDAGFARLESGQQQILDVLRGRGPSSSG